ncbi:hypothetical protein [Streptomyces murinus]
MDQVAGSAAPETSQSPVPAELVVPVTLLEERRVPSVHREHAEEVAARWSDD